MPIQKNIYRAAIDGISHIDDPRTIPFLVSRLASDEEWNRAEAARCLARLKAVETLEHVEASAARACVYRDTAALLARSAERLRTARDRAAGAKGGTRKARA